MVIIVEIVNVIQNVSYNEVFILFVYIVKSVNLLKDLKSIKILI